MQATGTWKTITRRLLQPARNSLLYLFYSNRRAASLISGPYQLPEPAVTYPSTRYNSFVIPSL